MCLVFRQCEVDTDRYEFSRVGHVMLLAPKAFRVLVSLVQRAGRVVAKQDLLREFWPRTAIDSY